MLTSIQEGRGASIVKYVAMGFILLATMGMVFMDVGGFFRSGIGGDATLAKVGRTKIDQITFERTALQSLRAQNMTLQEAYRFGLLQNLLQEMAMREALRLEAVRQGITFSREDLAEQVHILIKEQIQPGETSQETLTRVLRAQGMSESQFLASLRRDLGTVAIQKPLKASGAFLPNLLTQALARYQGERRDIVFFTLTPEGAGTGIKADDETLRAYYETVKDQYQIPEERTFRVIVLSSKDVGDTVKITDADVKAAYDERVDQFRVGERRKIEQLVLQNEDEAKAASETARKGKPLKGIAPAAYRDPIDVEKTGLPPELGTAVFNTENGTILNPIKTPLGWHVIHVVSVTPARTQNFLEMRDDLRKELESDALHTEMESRIARVDEMLGSGASLDETAQELNLAIRTVGPIDIQGDFKQGDTQDTLLTALAQNRDLLASLFELMEGETGDLAEINDGLYAAFSLESVRPTHDRDFDEVKSEVEKKWLAEQRGHALDQKVDELTAAISSGEKDFATAAKEAGAVLKTARDVSRTSKVAGLNDPIALSRLFDETNMNAVVTVPTENGMILASVLDARIPDADNSKLKPETKTQLRGQMEQAVTSLFLSDLLDRHDVDIKTGKLEEIYGGDSDDQP